MRKNLFSKIIIICLVCLTILSTCGFASFDAAAAAETAEAVPMYLNGIKVSDGTKFGETTYVSLKSFTEVIGGQTNIAWDEATGTITVTGEGLALTATNGKGYFTANGRYFYVPGGIFLLDNNLMVPVRELAKVFGAEIVWDEESSSVSIVMEQLMYPQSGDEFYKAEDLYWLARLINSESGNQPLDGKLAVGNVVLNRVADPTCPNTVYGVIFDRKYGVQFSVTETGAINAEPNEESVIAAKLCLEGYNIVGTSIYFVNPDIGVSSWFSKTRVFVASIGDHDFYA